MQRIPAADVVLKRKDAAVRQAFTLIELMIVVVIIATLMGLLLPAVIGAFRSTRIAQVITEIKGLESAIAQFKSIYGVEPPSSITLYQLGSGWSSDPSSVAKINRIWPNFNFSLNHDFDNNSGNTSPLTLTGAECLVFFLGGGHVTNPDDGSFAMVGFSKNPADPFAYSGGNEAREGPFFEFKTSRLKLSPKTANGNTLVYFDPSSGQTNPYVYASSYDGRGYVATDLVVNPGAGANNLTDVYRSSAPTPSIPVPPAQKPKSFQIISPGVDGKYGVGGYFSPTATNHGLSSKFDYDNLTNFHGGQLGD